MSRSKKQFCNMFVQIIQINLKGYILLVNINVFFFILNLYVLIYAAIILTLKFYRKKL
jgi:hypothetical protein